MYSYTKKEDKTKVKIAFGLIFSFFKKNMEIVSRLIFLFLIVCEIIICIYQYRTRPVYGHSTETDDIGIYDTVLAIEYTNYAWGYQNYGFVVNKDGQVKTFDFSDRKVEDEDLLLEFDQVLRDSSIPLHKEKIPLSADILRKVINVKDYKLRRPFFPELLPVDAGTYTYYSVCGSGINRKMLEMKVEVGSETVWKCNDRKINIFCEELGDSFSGIIETIWASTTEAERLFD